MKKIASKLSPLLLVLLLLRAAHAQVPDQQPLDLDETAAAHFALGVQAYQAGQWDAARAEFRVCYELSKKPDLLHNLSLVAEKQGKIAEALDLEREFLAKAIPQDMTAEEKAKIVARVASLERLVTPTPSAPPPESAPPVQREKSPSKAPRVLATVGLVSGGTLLVAALGTGIAGSLLKRDLESRPLTLTEFDQGRGLAKNYESATIALGVIGGALVIGSAVAAVIVWRRPRIETAGGR